VIGPQHSITGASAVPAEWDLGAVGDEPGLVVQRLGATLVDPEPDDVRDSVAVLADRGREPDEPSQAAAGLPWR
jgi:hypothetical protein